MRVDELLTLTRPLIGLDLETTGTSTKTDSIVEIGMEIMYPGQPPKLYRTLVNPMRPIPPSATAVHGITNEAVAGAPTFVQLAANMAKGCTGVDFIGYHVHFDVELFEEEMHRAGVEWDRGDAVLLDALRLWQILEPRTLTDAVARWPHPDDATITGDAHGALADIQRSSRRFAAMLMAHPELPRTPTALGQTLYPDRFDSRGKLRWRDDGALCIAFGQHRDTPLARVPRSYLNWILGADFTADVKNAVRDTLAGKPPLKK